MRFYIEEDAGHVIRGWVVPDNPIAISRVHVSVDGRRVAEVSATLIDENIRALGWHATGQCHFLLDESIVPGLAAMPRLEIHDVDTNLLVHRRVSAESLYGGKAMLVNTSIHPESVLQAALFPHFRQSYFGLGRLSEEVLRVIFDTPTMTSCLMSGAIVFPRYEAHFVQGNTVTMLLVHDPFVEMAQRLLWLQERAPLAADPAQRWRLGSLAEAAAFAAEYEYTDPKSLKRLFRMLPEPAYHLLYNPLTRQLGTRVPEDRLHPGNSLVAVEILARIGLVGHRDYFEAFATSVFDHLGIPAPTVSPASIPEKALALAERLRALKVAREMLTFDIVMSDAVRSSVAKSWDR